jgi:uncharacterized membrane protein
MENLPEVAGVVERNIGSLLARRRAENARRRTQDRVADAITRFTGSRPFVYIHLVLFGLWILINTGLLPALPRFDPSFVILAMAASVEAIFLSTFVLITQNRMAVQADKRADLDLQVSLLAEHEITRLIRLTTRIAGQLGIPDSRTAEITELEQDVHPEAVLKKMEDLERGDQVQNKGAVPPPP